MSALLDRLEDGEWSVRWAAVHGLAACSAVAQDVEVILAELLTRSSHAAADVRRAACQAIGRIAPRGHAGVTNAVTTLLQDGDPDVCRVATQALNSMNRRTV